MTLQSWPYRLAALVCALGFCTLAAAKPWWLHGVDSNESDFLPPDVAFRVSSRLDGTQLKVRWVIADGYYLYRQRMEIKPASPGLELAEPEYPSGIQKSDQYLGTQEIFQQQVEATMGYTRTDAGAHPMEIKVTYQGCAEAGLCYPPISKVLFADAPQPAHAAPVAMVFHPWEPIAIVGGAGAFLFAGFLLRKGRRLDTPTA